MLNQLREKTGHIRVVALFGMIYIISQVIIAVILHPLDSSSFLKAQTTFSKQEYLQILNSWDLAGMVGRYRLHFYFDFIHPVWYSVFLCALIAKGMKLNRISERLNVLIIIPFIAGLLDLIENIFQCFGSKYKMAPGFIVSGFRAVPLTEIPGSERR